MARVDAPLTAEAPTTAKGSDGRPTSRLIPPLLLLWAIGLAGGAMILWATPWGVGISHDSLFYFSAAENLVAGNGLFWSGEGGVLKPLVHFPPLYPALIALLIWAGVPPDAGARGLAAILFSLNVMLPPTLIYLWSKRLLPALAVGLVLLLSPVLVGAHLAALSEPLYLLISTAVIGLTAWVSIHPGRGGILALALAMSMGYLTRYVGVALFLAVPLILCFSARGTLRKRMTLAASVLGIAAVPAAAWLGRNLLLSGSATNRTLGFHPPGGDALRQFLDVVTAWFVPGVHSHWLEAALFGLALLAALALTAWLVTRRDERPRHLAILALGSLIYLITYLLGLLASLTLFDASTRIDSRILTPVFLAGVIAWFSLLGALPAGRRWRWIPALATGALLLLTARYSLGALSNTLQTARLEGMGFAGRAWHESETLGWIRGLPPSTIVYSDQPTALEYWTSRPARSIPQRLDPVTRLERGDYPARMESLRQDLLNQGAVMVLFYPAALPEESASFEDLTRGLELLLEASDASVYGGPASPGSTPRR